jgi:hypothetical protein
VDAASAMARSGARPGGGGAPLAGRRPPRPRALVQAILLLAVLAACAPAPPPGAPPRLAAAAPDLRIVVLSDLNGSYGSTTYEPEVHLAVALTRDVWRPDLVLISGDMIAGQRPSLPDELVRSMWNAFDSVVAGPLRAAGIPFAFALGNHDGSGHPGHERDRAFAEAFWRGAPSSGVAIADSARFPFYYSFSHGDLSVVAWDATTGRLAGDSVQLAWLRAALASPAARRARMRIVLGHLPLYAVAEGRNRAGEVLDEPDALRALLEEHGVRAYLSGHHHAYYPGRRGRLDLHHAGAAGQGARQLIGSALPPVQTASVLDLFLARDSIAYTAYRLSGAGAPAAIDAALLPAEIHGINGWVRRIDLAPW